MTDRAREEPSGRWGRNPSMNRRRSRSVWTRRVLTAAVVVATLGITAGVGTGAANGKVTSAETVAAVAHSDERVEGQVAFRMNLDLVAPEDVPRVEPVTRPPVTTTGSAAGSE
jgi:hypothetical protein